MSIMSLVVVVVQKGYTVLLISSCNQLKVVCTTRDERRSIRIHCQREYVESSDGWTHMCDYSSHLRGCEIV